MTIHSRLPCCFLSAAGALLAFICLPLVAAGAEFAVGLANQYRHSGGLGFRYPADWTLDTRQAADGVIVLHPPPALVNGTEVILVAGGEAGAIGGVQDPNLPAVLAAGMNSLAPGCEPASPPEMIGLDGGRQGLLMKWRVPLADGSTAVAVSRTSLVDGRFLVSLLALVPPDLDGKREPVLRAIFASFDFKKDRVATTMGGAGNARASLAGTWKNWEYKAVGSSSWEKTTFTTLRPDGTFNLSSDGESAHSVSIKNAQGNETAWGVAGSQNRAGGRTGTWTAADGRLTLTFNDGESLGATYEIRPNNAGYPILYLRPDGGKKASEWTRVN